MRASVRTVAPLAACMTALSLSPAASGAQRVVGTVEDPEGRPISEVHVSLLDGRQRPIAVGRSDDGGRFRVEVPSTGEYYLRLARIGYLTLFDGPYRLSGDDVLEARAVMHAFPVEMDPLEVTVSGRVRRLAEVGYYERRETGFGHFLERDEIMGTAPMHLTDALRRLPRAYVIDSGPGQLNPGLLIRGGTGFCRPTVYLDGAMAAQGGGGRRDPVRPDDWLAPEDVEAVEFYAGPASAPIRFGALAECGIMLIWTRHTPLAR